MPITVPDAPVSVTAAELKTALNIKSDPEAERVLQLATSELNRALAGAFRSMTQLTYDDLIRRIAGAIVGVKKRPAGSNGGQLTRVDQEAPAPVARDYLTPVRSTLANYVVPL